MTSEILLSDLSAVRLALLAKETRAQAVSVLRADPIAVVGMGCRVPGGAETPEAFWCLLRDGVDAVRETPADRWNAEDWFDPDPAAPAKAITRSGGFLNQVDSFDADYFDILGREADQMDPQQRLFLEVAIEAIDDAGVRHDQLEGARAGVFVASYHNDYAQMQYADLASVDLRTLTGGLHSVLANRLSFHLDLKGPSLSIDTACSSSLVAVHLACQSLRYGECDLALAGGVSLMITPGLMISMSKVGFMSPDGRCKTFDKSADGFGRGEGCGVVVLKRLSDAVAAGDRVLGVIRGSAVNQDGRSTVMAAPSGPAQAALIREALGAAQVPPARIGLVEAHGTGTALGDPIEFEAIAETIGRSSAGAEPCRLGSAKANLGHLEAAAGVVGLIKVVLALRHEQIPPQVHYNEPNPYLTLEGTRLDIPKVLTAWPRGAAARCAAVSSFGVGGTNAHVILEEAPSLPERAIDTIPKTQILPLSAKTRSALHALARSWIDLLGDRQAPHVALCAAAGEHRTHYRHRLAVVGSDAEELSRRLHAALASSAAEAQQGAPSPLAFVFCGQGAQWLGMGRVLLAEEPVFRDVMMQIDEHVRASTAWSLIEELSKPQAQSRLDETEVAQPALFAIQVALAALWASWGIEPDAVAGHSVGEIAALHVAGVLTLADATRLVVLRARAMQEVTGAGAMAATALTAEEALSMTTALGPRLSVAAFNAPRSTVLSGDLAAVDAALCELENRGVRYRRLPVNYAFHSAQMTLIAERFVAELGAVDTSPARIPVYSTVTGAVLPDVVLTPAHFARNVREPVRFAAAIQAMIGAGVRTFVEVGPHPVLGMSIAEILDDAAVVGEVLASVRRDRPERESLLTSLAALYVGRRTPNWRGVQQGAVQTVDLPAYPWQRKRHWLSSSTAPLTVSSVASTEQSVGFLGARIAGPGAPRFRAEWPAAAPGWLSDHRIGGRLLVPAAAMITSLWAAAEADAPDSVQIANLVIHHPLTLEEAEAACWQTIVESGHDGRDRVALYQNAGAAGPAWRLIASAEARPVAALGPLSILPSAPETGRSVDIEALYDAFASLGADFGPAFRTLASLTVGTSTAEAWLVGGAGSDEQGTPHPALIDGAMQACVAAASPLCLPDRLLLPLGVDRFVVLGPASGRVRAVLGWRHEVGGSLSADVALSDEQGREIARLEGVRFAPAGPEAMAQRGANPGIYELTWRPVERAKTEPRSLASDAWIVLGDEGRVGQALVEQLAAAGARALLVRRGNGPSASDGTDALTLDPRQLDQFTALIACDEWRAGRALSGVVHLWSLDIDELDSERSPDHERLAREDQATTTSGLHLLQAILKAEGACAAVFVTRGAQSAEACRPAAAALWGLQSVAMEEHPELDCRVLDLDPDLEVDPAALLGALRSVGEGRRRMSRGGVWLSPQLRRRPRSDATALRLTHDGSGTLDGLQWRPSRPRALGPDEVGVRVIASGLNFRDVLVALAMYPGGEAPLGVECAGVVERVGAGVTNLRVGETVFGYAPESLSDSLVCPAAFMAPAPASLAPMRAAAQPVAYLTAIYGLERLASLKVGQRVLIHAAAGGVGMAAVHVALRCGAEVFATAGSDEKRAFLRDLGVSHVYDSRSLDFVDGVMGATGGLGVDVLLNSLTGEFIAAGFKVLAQGGCFLELGKRDVWSIDQAARARPDVRYHVYDLGVELSRDAALASTLLADLAAALESGALPPLPVRLFEAKAAPEAFRFMAQARHIGKLALAARASGTAVIRPDGSYWITGGHGALGLHTARWLVEQGARSLVLTGRRGPDRDGDAALADLRAAGADVVSLQADASDVQAMQGVLDHIQSRRPPLRGVIHAAGLLDDGVLQQQTWARAEAVIAAKAHGAFVLDHLTRDLPLDLFILYSAAGLLLGAPGQACYAAANAELDALAHARRRAGRPALSIAWGLWSGEGMGANDTARGAGSWSARGLGTIDPAAAFAPMAGLLRAGVAHAAILPIDWERFLASRAWQSDGYFDAVAPVKTARLDREVGEGLVDQWRRRPAAQRPAAILAHIREQTLGLLGADPGLAIDPDMPLKESGLDSLMAVELRNVLSRSIARPLPATLLFDYPSLTALTSYVSKTLGFLIGPQSVAAPDAAAAVVALSDGEAEAELLAELASVTGGAL